MNNGRDFIKALSEDPDYHVLTINKIDSNGVTPHTEEVYNVLVVGYDEKLVRRDVERDMYFWDCSLQLEEVV